MKLSNYAGYLLHDCRLLTDDKQMGKVHTNDGDQVKWERDEGSMIEARDNLPTTKKSSNAFAATSSLAQLRLLLM